MTRVAVIAVWLHGNAVYLYFGLLIAVAVGKKWYDASTKDDDARKSSQALSAIRRCSSCKEVVSSDATSCRHCLAEL